MKNQLKRIEPNIIITTSDSRDSSFVKNTWLSGGTMSSFFRKCNNYIDQSMAYSDKLRRWNSVVFTNEKKKLVVIIMYQMLISSTKGVHTNRA